jgi:hypothetical protein
MPATGCADTLPLPGHRSMAQVIAEEQGRYDIRKTKQDIPKWYVGRAGTRIKLSMHFDTLEQAEKFGLI